MKSCLPIALPVAVRSPVAPVENEDRCSLLEQLEEVNMTPFLVGQLQSPNPLPDVQSYARLRRAPLLSWVFWRLM